MVREIERKSWSNTFKQKTTQLYYQFKQAGFKLDIHAIARLNRLNQKNFVEINAIQVLNFLKNNHANFYQEHDKRLVYFSEKMQIAVIQSANDSKIVTIIRMKKEKSEWKILK